MKINDILLQSIRTLIQQEIEKASFNKTKQGIITKNYTDGTYDVRFDGNLYTKILTYPNFTSLQLGQTVKIIIPNNQASQMYISAESSPLIYYPVGSYYETSDTTFDPNTAWGGTWYLETEGQVHVSSGRQYAVAGADITHYIGPETVVGTSDGGSKDAILASHTHTLTRTTNVGVAAHGVTVTQPTIKLKVASPNNTGTLSTSQVQYGRPTGTNYTNDNAVSKTNVGVSLTNNHSVTQPVFTADTRGEAVTDKNLQPYIVVNRWHRIA